MTEHGFRRACTTVVMNVCIVFTPTDGRFAVFDAGSWKNMKNRSDACNAAGRNILIRDCAANFSSILTLLEDKLFLVNARIFVLILVRWSFEKKFGETVSLLENTFV